MPNESSPQHTPVTRARFTAIKLSRRGLELSEWCGLLESQYVRKSTLADGQRNQDIPHVRKEHGVLQANGHLHRLASTDDHPRFRLCGGYSFFSDKQPLQQYDSMASWACPLSLSNYSTCTALCTENIGKLYLKRMKVYLFRRLSVNRSYSGTMRHLPNAPIL